MFYSATQSFLHFLRILNRLEVCVFARAVKLESPCRTVILVYIVKVSHNASSFNPVVLERKILFAEDIKIREIYSYLSDFVVLFGFNLSLRVVYRILKHFSACRIDFPSTIYHL
jgi:hypothetical protein